MILYLDILLVKCNIFFQFFGIHSSDAREKKDRLLSARLLPARCRSCAVDVGVYATGVEAGSAVLCTTFLVACTRARGSEGFCQLLSLSSYFSADANSFRELRPSSLHRRLCAAAFFHPQFHLHFFSCA